jgi:hypothetical protein
LLFSAAISGSTAATMPSIDRRQIILIPANQHSKTVGWTYSKPVRPASRSLSITWDRKYR